MRLPADFLLTVLAAAVLLALAELAHGLLMPDLQNAPSFSAFAHAGLLLFVLSPLFAWLLHRQVSLHKSLRDARITSAQAQARAAVMHEALRGAHFTAFEHRPGSASVRLLHGERSVALEAWWRRCHPDDVAAMRESLAAFAAGTRTADERLCRVRGRGGGWRWQRIVAQLRPPADGSGPRCVVGSVCDVTRERVARRQLSANQHLLQAVLDILPLGVFWKDAEGRYLGANRVFLQHYGLPRAVGLHDEDFLDAPTAALYRQHDRRVMGEGKEERNALHASVDAAGGTRWYRSSKVLLRDVDGEVVGVVGTFDDVSSLIDTERTLRETTQRFELALEGASDGLWDWNLRTNDVYYSPRFKALLGYRDEEFGNDFASYEACLHPADRALVHAALARHLDGEGEVDIEYRLRHSSGEWRWYRTRGLALPDADGVRKRMAGTLSDVTERKARELEIAQARAHLSDAIEALDSGIVMFDANQQLVFCNARYREVYELPAALVQAGVSYRALTEAFCARFPQMQRERSPEEYAAELFERHRTGGRPWELELPDRWLLLSERPTQDGGVVCLHTDITRLKQTQRALELALQRAEAANRAKSQFVANISHELRTPLNGVIGMLQLLGDSPLPAPQDDYVQVATQSARALLDLINDVLDFSRHEAGIGEVADEEFSLPLLIDEIVVAHARRAQAKGLALLPFIDPAVPERVRGDPACLGQVLTKLVGNAIKFTERGEVRVEVHADEEADRFRLVVDDTGIGIALDAQSTIFEPFTQGDGSQTRRYGGTGLGLALSRQQVERMGGSLTFSSAPGRGSRFECHLRLVAGPPTPPPAPTSLLLVGPSAPWRPALIACLRRCGADVFIAEDLAQATAGLRGACAAVLLDLSLPEAEIRRFVRLADAQDLRCAGLGQGSGETLSPTLQSLFPTVLRPPITYAAVVEFMRGLGARGCAHDPGVPVLDEKVAARLEEALGAAGFAELVAAFGTTIHARLADYRDACADGDEPRQRQLVHAMKGVGANLGALRFVAACDVLERRAARGDPGPDCAALALACDETVARLRAGVRRRSEDLVLSVPA